MADWDQDSPELRENLKRVLCDIRDSALRREALEVETIREWHGRTQEGLSVPNRKWIGHFRGEAGLKHLQVHIGAHSGTPASEVAAALADFNTRLGRVIERLDQAIAPEDELTADSLNSVLNACAWAHSEWVRMHPFANGNGRTARLLANAIALRYGLPPFVRLRPRPNQGYPAAAEASMRGDYQPLATAFGRMLDACLSDEN